MPRRNPNEPFNRGERIGRAARKVETPEQRKRRKARQAKAENALVRSRSVVVKRIVEGDEDLSKWTTKELLQGFPDGGRGGRRPKFVPAQVHQEMARRVMSYGRFRFIAELEYAIAEHIKIIKAPLDEVGAMPKLKAIQMLYDQLIPVEAQVNLRFNEETAPWQKMMAAGIVNTTGSLRSLEGGEEDEPEDDEEAS